jgi:type II secretory pathway predicted ATPase ExeA
MKTTSRHVFVVLAAAVIGLGAASCEKKGPLEKAGEEIDEAVDTVKNGGEEPVAAKIDDAVDDAAKKVDKATK